MNIHISIKSYERQEMLVSLIEEIEIFIKKNKSHNVFYHIIDDCSKFSKQFVKSNKIIQTPKNYGKKLHWKVWDMDFDILGRKKEIDLFIFLPSDVSKVNFNEIIKQAESLKDEEYFFNIINDGRQQCWNRIQPEIVNQVYSKVGFTDCCFFTNRKTLDRFGFFILEVDPERFKLNKNISSGVGEQFTRRLYREKINIFHPHNSFAFHGDHESIMHKEERKKNPLISAANSKLDKPIYVGIATMKGREESLKKTLESLNNQTLKPTKIIVYNNAVEKVDYTDNAKFYGLSQIKGHCYYFSCDDDLEYDFNYIQDMVNAIIKHKCIVTHHGRILLGLSRNYFRGHKAFRCLGDNREECFIDVAGTGVTAFDTSYFNDKTLFKAQDKRMSDLVFSLRVARERKKIKVLKHHGNYIKQLPIDHSTSCYTTESINPVVQNQIADEIFILNH